MATVYSIKPPDMSRNTALAGQTVTSRGMDVTYNDQGYAVKASKAAPKEGTIGALLAANNNASGSGTGGSSGGSGGSSGGSGGSSGSYGTGTGSYGTGTGSYGAGTGSAYDGSYGSGYSSVYQDALKAAYDAQQAAYAEQRAANEAAVRRAIEQIQAQKTTVNASYDDYARQAYRDKMGAERDIDQYLGARGVTGGAAESTILGLNTSYADELRRIEQSRRETVNTLDQAISEARLTGDLNNAKAAADAAQAARELSLLYAKEYSSLYAQELAERKAAAATQEQYARAEAQAQQSWARTMASQMLAAGRMPDDATLAAAGITRAQAELLLTQTETVEAPAYTPVFTLAQVQNEISRALKYGTPLAANVLRDYEYYYGEPYSAGSTPSSGASSGSSGVSYNNGGYSTAEIKVLQQWLRTLGYNIAVDGYWGTESRSTTGMSAKDAMAWMHDSKNAGIPQSLIEEINRDAEGSTSIEALTNIITRWVSSGKITKAQADWIAESFGF